MSEAAKIAARAYLEARTIPVTEVGCWLWTESLKPNGYGRAWWKGKTTTAHRVALVAKLGFMPKGKLGQHKCDNRWCANPEHVKPGTDASNAYDKQIKGRAARKITLDVARAIKSLLIAEEPHRAIAVEFGVHHRLVWAINRGVAWSHA